MPARQPEAEVPELIDVGANLTHESFRDDLPDVLERAARCGVRRLVVTGTTLAASRAALEMARARPGVLWATAGVHPHAAAGYDDATEDALRTMLRQPLVVAAGECGLDYNRDYSPRNAQRAAFARQVELAAASGRPLFLHQRDAHQDFLAILREQGSRLPAGVAHCFTNGPEEMADYLDLGLHIGITGWICDERRSSELRGSGRLPAARPRPRGNRLPLPAPAQYPAAAPEPAERARNASRGGARPRVVHECEPGSRRRGDHPEREGSVRPQRGPALSR